MGEDSPQPSYETLKRRVVELEACNKELEALVRKRVGQLCLNLTNSSLPPSTDVARGKPVQRRLKPTGRKRGGQPGHPGATRQPFPAD